MTMLIGEARSGKGRERPGLSTRRRNTPSLKLARAKPVSPPLNWGALLAEQRDRAILWLPMTVIAGAALHWLLPRAPALWLGPAILGGGAALALLFAAWQAQARWTRALRFVLAYACVLAAGAGLGLSAGSVRERLVASPKLAAETGPVLVDGWVRDLDRGASRPRLTILVSTIEGVDKPPLKVRISTTTPGALTPGRAVRCRAILHPPAGPMAPGAYDSAFAAYFEQIGATGFSLGACRPLLDAPPVSAWDAFWLKAAALRRALTESILDIAPGRGGAVAAALITGDQSAIDNTTNTIFLNSGLQHLLSVSGFHMSLVAGMIYAAAHVGLALIPGMALRFPIRKWAAAAAILGAGLYLLISGVSVPAQRAFIMSAVVLGAILIDRPAITMRSLAVAALIVTLLAPEAVLTPGFQMSFAATAALIAAFEMYQAKRETGLPTPGLLIASLQSAGRWMAGALLASFVAGLATDPFAMAHFQRVQFYALPANLAATPVITLIVTPAAGAAAALAPFGVAEWPLKIMAWGLDLLVAIGGSFSSRPEAVRGVPKPPDIAFVLCCAAIAWACLWRGKLRYAALAPLAAAALLYALSPRPILMTDGALQAVIARTDQKGAARWTAMASRGAAFERERLAQLVGIAAPEAQALAAPADCGEAVCRWRTPRGRAAVFVQDASALETACEAGAIVVTRAPPLPDWRARCKPALVIAPDTLTARGGAAIYETQAGLSIVRARVADQQRAWDGALTDSAE